MSETCANLKQHLASLKHNPNGIVDIGTLNAWHKADPRERYPKVDCGAYDTVSSC